MCDYVIEIEQAATEFAERGVNFDVLDIRDRVRQLAGPDVEVLHKPVKYELLAFFERGGLPGFVIGTKIIHNDDGSMGRSVFEFRMEHISDRCRDGCPACGELVVS